MYWQDNTTCQMLGFLHALFLMVSYWQSSIIDAYYLRLNDLCLFRKTQVQITWYQYYLQLELGPHTHYTIHMVIPNNPEQRSQLLSIFPELTMQSFSLQLKHRPNHSPSPCLPLTGGRAAPGPQEEQDVLAEKSNFKYMQYENYCPI